MEATADDTVLLTTEDEDELNDPSFIPAGESSESVVEDDINVSGDVTTITPDTPESKERVRKFFFSNFLSWFFFISKWSYNKHSECSQTVLWRMFFKSWKIPQRYRPKKYIDKQFYSISFFFGLISWYWIEIMDSYCIHTSQPV